jgi:hypothetical protein
MTPAVTTIVRVGTWALVGILAALGLITAGGAVVLPTLVAAGVGALVGWALAHERSALVALGLGAACGVGVLAIAGLAVVTGPATVIAAPAVVAPLLWTRRRRASKACEAAAADQRSSLSSVSSLSSLSSLSNAQLAREWHTSYTALKTARDPKSLELICALRRRQLDEIERRAPGGFDRWISSGTWVRGDSAPFLGG